MSERRLEPVSRSRLAIHTITNKPWTLRECVAAYAEAGVGGISVWRESIEPIGITEASRILSDSGLRVTAMVRGGFFVHPDKSSRQEAIDTTRGCVEEAAAVGADMLVIVPGAHPAIGLPEGREVVQEALHALVGEAAAAGVRLALEPLHPMYAADRSCVNTLRQARTICDSIDHPNLGVAVDVYHVWWDDDLQAEIAALGQSRRLFAFHANDWLPDTNDFLLDRGLMGEGCIPIRRIRGMMEDAGFDGTVEVEILSRRWWEADQPEFLQRILLACETHV